MHRALLIIVLVTATLATLATFWLVSTQSPLAWRFVPERMIRDYVIALFICKEDVHRGATALAQLQATYGVWREELLPHGIYYWVVQCDELSPMPEFGSDVDQWLQ